MGRCSRAAMRETATPCTASEIPRTGQFKTCRCKVRQVPGRQAPAVDARNGQKQPLKFDLISMLAHGEATRDLPSRPQEFMGNLLLLIVGGNDTTRNSISGGLWFLNQFPEEYAKLRADPGLIPKMVPEIIRYQSPVVHMRRTAAAASAFVLRVRHSPLRRQPAGGDAADDPVEGNPEALPADRSRRETEAGLLQPDPRHHRDEGAHPGVNPRAPAGPIWHQGAGPPDPRALRAHGAV